jgi:hypothetical protein
VIVERARPRLPSGVPARHVSEGISRHESETAELGFHSTVQVEWSTFSRTGGRYVDSITVRTTRAVAPDAFITIGTGRVERNDAGESVHVVPFAASWINRRGAFVHHYFLVLSNGSLIAQGTYVD